MRCMLDDGSCAGNGRIGTCVRGSFELDEKNFCDREVRFTNLEQI